MGGSPRAPAKRRDLLTPQAKAIVAAKAVLSLYAGTVEEKDIGPQLRRATGLQWSFLTALQYVSGQEAIRALQEAIRALGDLPDDWSDGDLTKADLGKAVMIAAGACAAGAPSGSPLSGGHLVSAVFGRPWPKTRRAPREVVSSRSFAGQRHGARAGDEVPPGVHERL